jgi:MFS family permease
MALSAVFVPNDRPEQSPVLDISGFVLSGTACAALMYGVDLIARHDTPWLLAGALLGASVFSGILTLRHGKRHPRPLLDLSALRIPTFSVMMMGGSLFRIAINAMPFLLPLLFQVGFGVNAFTSGLLVLALFAGNVAMKPLTTPMLRRYGFRSVLVTNGLLAAATMLACALLYPRTPVAMVVAILFVGGLCRSMQFTALNTIGFADVPAAQMSGANTLFSTVMQMSMALGIAFGAVALRFSLVLRGSTQLAVADFHFAFVLVAIVGTAAVYDCFGLDRDAAAVVSGHRRPAESQPA